MTASADRLVAELQPLLPAWAHIEPDSAGFTTIQWTLHTTGLWTVKVTTTGLVTVTGGPPPDRSWRLGEADAARVVAFLQVTGGLPDA